MEKLIEALEKMLTETKERREGASELSEYHRDSGVIFGLEYALDLAKDLVEDPEKVVEELKVGDTVESLIGYITVTKGMKGTVNKVRTSGNWEYPIEVRFPSGSLGAHFLDDCVMFNPHELRKVA